MDGQTKKDLIDRYLNDEMSMEEKQSFEQEAQEDEELQEIVLFYKSLQNRVRDTALLEDIGQELEEQGFFEEANNPTETLEREEDKPLYQMIKDHALLQDITETLEHEEFFTTPPATSAPETIKNKKRLLIFQPQLFRPLAYAAGFIGLIIALTLFAQYNYSDSALARIDNSELNLNLRVPQTLGNDPLQEALANWIKAKEQLQSQNYREATALLERIPEESNIFSDAQLYLSYAYLQLRDFQTAEGFARKALGLVTHEGKKMQADWLLVKSLVGQGDPRKELPAILRDIYGKSSHTFANEAAELEKELNSFWRRLVWN